MSRTYKTRPQWVKLNDPKFPTKERHQHHVVKSEKIGERKYIHQAEEVGRDEYGKVLYRIPEHSWNVAVYRRWTENVPCTIDIPEMSWREARHRRMNGSLEKLCDKRPLVWSCSCCSRRGLKRATNSSIRAKIKQQLHMAVRANGHHTVTDPDASIIVAEGVDEYGTLYQEIELPSWWDVDVTEKHFDSYKWD